MNDELEIDMIVSETAKRLCKSYCRVAAIVSAMVVFLAVVS